MTDLVLQGISILMTRAADDPGLLATDLQAAGAVVCHMPVITIKQKQLDTAIYHKIISRYYDWIIFTSQNAAKYFYIQVSAKKSYSHVIAIGAKTRSYIEGLGIKVDFSPKEFNAESLLNEFDNTLFSGKNVLLPCSDIARDQLAAGLSAVGSFPEKAIVYENTITPLEDISSQISAIRQRKPDCFIFTSPSTFNNFLKIMDIAEIKDYFEGRAVAVIGPTTRLEVERHGIQRIIQPKRATIENLTAAIIEHFAERGKI